MRRGDREVKDLAEKLEIVAQCDVCRLAFAHENEAYLVPMNFGHEYIEGQLVLYFHCASKGKKLDMMQKNPKVCFEMDRAHALRGEGEIGCVYTMDYESVIGFGRLEVCETQEEKRHGLEKIMRQTVKREGFTYLPEHINAVTVLRLSAREFSAKRHGVRQG